MGNNVLNRLSIGVDVGSTTLRAVALRQSGTGVEVVAATETQRTPNHVCPIERDVQRLISAMQRQGVNMHRIAISASPDRLATSILELPPRSSGAPVESLANAEMSKTIKGPFESRLWDLPSDGRQGASEYFSIAYSHEDATQMIQPFENEGVVVEAIEPEVVALGRVTGANSRVIIDAGRRSVRLYALEGSNVLFARNIAHSSGTDVIQKASAGIGGTIDYLASRFPSLENATIVVLGQPDVYDKVCEIILQDFEADITNDMPIDLVPKPWLSGINFDSKWATAIGLAMRSKEAA